MSLFLPGLKVAFSSLSVLYVDTPTPETSLILSVTGGNSGSAAGMDCSCPGGDHIPLAAASLLHPHPPSAELGSQKLNVYLLAKGENQKLPYLMKIAVTIVLQLFWQWFARRGWYLRVWVRFPNTLNIFFHKILCGLITGDYFLSRYLCSRNNYFLFFFLVKCIYWKYLFHSTAIRVLWSKDRK